MKRPTALPALSTRLCQSPKEAAALAPDHGTGEAQVANDELNLQ